MRRIVILGMLFASACALAEIEVVDGVRYECKDGLCRIVEDEPSATAASEGRAKNTVGEGAVGTVSPVGVLKSRMLEGYRSADDFVKWLGGDDGPADVWMTTRGHSGWAWFAALFGILLGGLAMNLTPCVLPMVPINLMVIGKSAVRGAWYGLGIALAYGALGAAAAVGGLAFGTIQGSPWFNLGVAVVFVLLSLALADVFFIDLSKGRNAFAQKRASMLPWLFAFLMGVLSAVLAGACVAPVLIGVLVMTAKLYAEGKALALALPFALGVGMALPWPFLGAGLKVLPSPGRWMKAVNRLFALVVLGFAVWYGRLAWLGFGFGKDAAPEAGSGWVAATPETLEAKLAVLRAESSRPILVDCWATWCKNCAAMERVMEEPQVREALKGFSVVRLQAEDMKKLKALRGFESVTGLPAYVILYNEPTGEQAK